MLTWRGLNDKLNTLSEDEVYKLLQAERRGPKRVSMLQRLHQRYSALRVSRERIEILREATQP
jgi:hypothetical protein